MSKEISEKADKTVVSKEVIFFSDQHKAWWDLEGPLKPLHTYNFVRVPLIRENVANARRLKADNSLERLKVMDVGCGGGILSEALAKYGADVTGLDASEELIEVAKSHAENNQEINGRVRYVADRIEEYSLKHGSTFDVVVVSEVVEHVDDPDIFLKYCCDLLKPGGSIIVTTINRTITSFLIAIIYVEYITGACPKGTHEWKKFVTPEEVSKSLRKYGCDVTRIQGVNFHASTQSWSIRDNTSVFYFLHAVKSN